MGTPSEMDGQFENQIVSDGPTDEPTTRSIQMVSVGPMVIFSV